MSCMTTTTADNGHKNNNSNDNTNDSIVELKLQSILNAKIVPTLDTTNFRKWFLQQFNNDECTLENFAVYFFNTVRHQASIHLRPSEESIEENFDEKKRIVNESKTIALSLQSNSFPELGTPTTGGQVPIRNASTPTRKSLNMNSPKQHMQTPTSNARRSVENANNRNIGSTPSGKNNSLEKSRNSIGETSIGSSSFCLGDFLTSPTVSSRHNNAQKKKIPPNTTSTPNSSSNNNNNNNNSNTKPRKRVVPISIGKTSTANNCAFGSNSSFSQENNIQQLSNTEAEMKDFNPHSISEARKALKHDISEVSSVIKASAVADLTQSVKKLHIKSTQIEFDEKLTHSIRKALEEIPTNTSAQLKILASIYGLLLDMNLTINILQEISLLLNLLNANVPIEIDDVKPKSCKTIEINSNILNSILKNISNCIYFALCVLENQQHTLALIDIKSLGVVLQSERLVCLSPNLSNNLNTIYSQKQSLSNSSQYIISSISSNSGGFLKNVYFQEDTDSRQFFYSNHEFGAFKTQRDLFYSTLKHWEKHHLYPTWKFTYELSPKVREIFRQSENPINMIHFAKLFLSQLLISGNEQHTAAPPKEFGIEMMDDADLKKFTKLSQRLVAPSDFSVDYQFPREQAFFRDFIIESRSLAFMEHLKIVLFSELVTLNDSQFEELNSMTNTNNIETSSYEENEFIVRPQILSSMIILAKFLGFILALPFHGGGGSQTQMTTIIENEQLSLRRLFHPAVNICEILENAIQNGRHLITLPWLVQYLAMLDDVTLQLYSHVETIHKLYELYMNLGNSKLQITPTSGFIVRCCLGWLFEQKPSIGREYINYRIKFATHTIAVDEKRIQIQNSIHKLEAAKADLKLKPILDTILSVACPFLGEFRVSIMPTRYAITKNVSRSGRFRHITPCIAAESPINQRATTTTSQMISSNVLEKCPSNVMMTESINTSSSQGQKLLMESFLHSQNSSIRRLIVFLSERVYKCVIKDAQYQILIPSKEMADNEINKITKSIDKQYVLEQVKLIYQNAYIEANKKWNENIPIMINDRINRSLDALLSIETTPIIKKAYGWRIKCDASMKIEQWRHLNLYKQDFYCNDINELASKICKANSNRSKKSNLQTTELILIQSQLPRISDLIEEMQHWLYTTGFQTSFQPEMFAACYDRRRDVALIEFLQRLKSSFVNTLPTIYYRLIGAGLIQILQHMITLNPTYISADLIEACCKFFLDSKICIADAASTTIKDYKHDLTTVESGDYDQNTSNSAQATTTTKTTIYQSLITAPFLQSLGTCSLSYEKLKALLHGLIQAGVVTMGFVNDLFMTAFKEDLDMNVLNAISKMLYELSNDNNYDDDGPLNVKNLDEDADCESELKSHLLMEVLADLSRNLNDF